MEIDKNQLPFEEAGIKELDQTYSHQQFLKMLDNPVINNAMGCLFGSFIGDALGAYLQFSRENFDKMFIDVMKMPGGGAFRVKEGQITDDSQLAFHLLNSLTKLQLTNQFDAQLDGLILTISKQYLKWHQSKPFDIGNTCRESLNAIKRATQKRQNLSPQALTQHILAEVRLVSSRSESNGSLMRIAPIPFIFSLINKPSKNEQKCKTLNQQIGLTQTLMKSFINKQTSLLHPNINNISASYIWSKYLIALIKRNSNQDIPQLVNSVKKHFEKSIPEWGCFLTQKHPIKATQNIGWSKIAIALSFDVLDKYKIHENSYSQMIKYVLSKGGDTDTNAAIVGGMVGSIVGFKNLPAEYLRKLLQLRHNGVSPKGRLRPVFYEPRYAFANAYKIIRMLISLK